jgi:FkbM family methyltransferase
VDVGAHHPTRFSNTFLFYKHGWRGINLDATPGSMAEFERRRPLDRNLEIAIAESDGVLTFHCFNEPALNTFSKDLAESYLALPQVRRLATRPIACRTLASVLESELPPGRQIDFLNIDVEGLDLEVLRSNDWERFRPEFVLVESLETELSTLANNPSARFMASVAYSPIAKTVNTLFFRDDRTAPRRCT